MTRSRDQDRLDLIERLLDELLRGFNSGDRADGRIPNFRFLHRYPANAALLTMLLYIPGV